MATITGTSLSERITALGTYYWNGTAWVFISSLATTSGIDTVHGGAGNDVIDGGAGNDSLYGDDGNDQVIGGAGNDLVDGGNGNDILYGGTAVANSTGSGTDDMRGGAGNDTIYAGDGNDKLQGNDGTDILYGEAGNDALDGGAGQDTMVGGAGADTLTGGLDGDTFVYNAASDSAATAAGAFSASTGDIISGFTSAAETATLNQQDKIDFRTLVAAIGHSIGWGGTIATSYGAWASVAGGVTTVNVDTNGDAVADLAIRISSTETLTINDFLGLVPADLTAPTVASAIYGSNDGTLKAGETVTLTVNFSETVVVTGANPSLTLNSGGTATYSGGSGTASLTFSYTVGAGQNAADLAINAINLNGGAIKDLSGLAAVLTGAPFNPAGTLAVDTAAPNAPAMALDSASDSGTSNSDHNTSDNTPTLTGTAEANAAIAIFDGVTQIGTTTANGVGAWTFTAGTLADGVHNLTVKATDLAGNQSPASVNLAVTIDMAAPATTLALDPASDLGASNSDYKTSDNTPTLTGTAEANASITIFDGVTQIGTTTADGAGAWTFTTGSLADGTHNLTATATDLAGNTGSASANLAVAIDTSAPAAPAMVLDAASDSGSSNADGKTNDNTPTLSGTAEADASIAIFDGVTQIGTTTADGSGAWTFTAGTLGDGLHNLTAKASDISGNQSLASANLAVTIDTAAPSASSIALDPLSDSGASSSDRQTNDTTPTLTGTAEANASIAIFDGVTQIGTTAADGAGAWTFTAASLGDGLHNLTVKATDAAGNQGSASANLAVTIDTAAPAAPAIALDPASDLGTLNNDHLTSDNTPTLTGTAEANATVTVFDGLTQIGTTTANGAGAWTFTAGVLGDGTHNLSATATDIAGNLGPASANLAIDIDTVAPGAPTITLDPASDTGTLGDGVTADNTPSFTGTAVAGASVSIYDGANLLGQTTANGSGNWVFTTGTLGDGNHNFTAKTGDAAGNLSLPSSGVALSINATTPTIVETHVTASSDDAEQAVSTGAVNLTSSDLELINEADGVGNQIVGVRFANLAVPVGAVITKAYVQFYADESQSEATNLTIHAQASTNASTFTAATNNIGGRPVTASSVTWSPTAWTTSDLNGTAEKTPDISSVVQEVVSLAGWTQNNSIAFIFSGSGHRTAASFDEFGATQVAVLHVEYIMGGSNDAPVAGADAITINEDTPTTIAVLANDSDANGDQLVVTGTGQAGHGTVAINVDNTITYTPTANYNGADSFTYTISDGHGGTSTATVSVGITPVNDAPVANADQVFSLAGTPVTVAVLANDTDADGDTLQVTGIGSATHGTAVLNANGTISYTANVGYTGADSFTYDIADGHGGIATGTATVTTLDASQSLAVEARVSTASDDAEQALTNFPKMNVTAGQMFLNSEDLELINDHDYVQSQAIGIRFHDLGIPVGAVITKAYIEFTTSIRTIADPVSLTIHAQDSVNAGTFTTTANNITSRAVTASAATWQPDPWLAAGDHGTAQQSVDISALVQEVVSKTGWSPDNALAFIITGIGSGDRSAMTFDENPASAPVLHVEFTLGTANAGPVAAADNATTDEDTAVVINGLGNDSDPDLNPLIAAAAGPAAHGTVAINADNTITYTPYANYNGADSFNYTLSDGHGGLSIATVSVNVTPVNDAPQAVNDLAVTAADTAVTVKVLANDLDVDNDPLTVNAGAGAHGTTVVQANGSVLYTPDAGFTGIDTFNYTVLDGHGGSDTATATVHVGTGFGTTTFAAVGDFGVANGHELAVANMIKAKSPDFIVTMGDNTYGAGLTPDLAVGQYYSDYIGNYHGVYGLGSATDRFFPALSNHDWTDSGIKAYDNFFTIPESSSHDEHYYDFTQGPVQFFVMDTDPRDPVGFAPGSAQYQWLQNGLQNSVTPWQIVVVPSPPYSSGSTYGSNPATQLPYEQWGADAVLSGDDHDYERIMKDANGDGVQLPYFVNGLGGASNLPINAPVAGSTVQYNTDYGAMMITASDTQLHFEFWSIAGGGTLIDQYTINMPLA